MIEPSSLERIYSSIGQYKDPTTGEDLTLQAAIYAASKLEKAGYTSLDQLGGNSLTLLDDQYGTVITASGGGVQKSFDPVQKVATQMRGSLASGISGGAWTTKSGGSSPQGFGTDGMLRQLATRFINQTGLTDFNNLGARPVTETRQQTVYPNYQGGYYYFVEDGDGYYQKLLTPQESQSVRSAGIGDDGNPYFVADVPSFQGTEYFDKSTGNKINFSGSLGGWGEGPGFTWGNIVAGPNGKIQVSTWGEDSSDVGFLQPILTVLSFVPGVQPFAIALNAAIALEKGDVLGAVASVAGLAGLNEVATIARVAKAVESGDVLGAALSAGLGSSLGNVEIADGISVKEVLRVAKAADAISRGDYGSALMLAGQAFGSEELVLAGQGLNLAKAIESGNPNAIANAAGQAAVGYNAYAEDQTAKNEGWSGIGEKKSAISFFGSNVTPGQWKSLGQYVDYSTGDAFGTPSQLENVVSQYRSITGSEPTALQVKQFKDIGNGDAERGLNLSTITEAEARSFLEANGYSPNDAEVRQFAGLATEEATRANIANYVDPRQTDYAEALSMLGQLGYNPSEAEVRQFVGQINEDTSRANIAAYVNPRQTTYAEARSFLEANGYSPTDAEIRQFVGQVNENVARQNVAGYVNPRQTTYAEARSFLEANGYSPSDAEIRQFIGQVDEATAKQNIANYINPRQTTYAEAKSFLEANGYNPSDDEVRQFIGQVDENVARSNISSYVNPRQTTYAEARSFLEANGFNPTDAEIRQFVGQVNEETARANIAAYVNPRQTTYAEAKSFLEANGFNPTDAEIRQFVGQVDEATAKQNIANYVNPRQTTYAEALSMLGQLGYNPTDAEVRQFVGQVNEDLARQNIANYINPRQTTYAEAKSFLEANGYNPSDEEIRRFVGQVNEDVSRQNIASYVGPRQTTYAEAKNFLEANGYSPSDAEIRQFVGQVNEDAAKANIAAYVNPRQTTYEEARSFLEANGFSPTDAEIRQFIGQVDESVAKQNIANYINPRQTTYAEAKSFLEANGYNPTDAEIRQFVGQVNEDISRANIAGYVNPRQTTFAEAKAFFEANGYNPTDAEVRQFVGQVNEDASRANISGFVNPRQTTYAEALAMLGELGYSPSDAEIRQFVGQINEDASRANVAGYVNPRQTTFAEAKSFLEANGYSPSDAEVRQFVGQVNEDISRTNIAGYVNPRQTTFAEAKSFLEANGYTPSDAEVRQFVGQINEDVAKGNIATYVDKNTVTPQEAENFFKSRGYTPNKNEIENFSGQVNESTGEKNIESYIDPRQVTTAEAREFLEVNGYVPTEEELRRFTGQKDEAATKAEADKYIKPKVEKIQNVLNLLNQGKLSPEQVEDELKAFGFQPQQVFSLFAANADAVDRSRKAQSIVIDYADIGSDLSREGAVQRLVKETGITEDVANNYLGRVDTQVNARNDFVNKARQFLSGSVTEDQLKEAMDATGITGQAQTDQLNYYRAIRAGSELTSSETTQAAVAGLNTWNVIPDRKGTQVVFDMNDEGSPYVKYARDSQGRDITNLFYGSSPQALQKYVEQENQKYVDRMKSTMTKTAESFFAPGGSMSNDQAVASLKASGLTDAMAKDVVAGWNAQKEAIGRNSLNIDQESRTTSRMLSFEEFERMLGAVNVKDKLSERYLAYVTTNNEFYRLNKLPNGQFLFPGEVTGALDRSAAVKELPRNATVDAIAQEVYKGVAAGAAVGSPAQNYINSLNANLISFLPRVGAGLVSEFKQDAANDVAVALRGIAEIGSKVSDQLMPEFAAESRARVENISNAKGWDKFSEAFKWATDSPLSLGSLAWSTQKEITEDLVFSYALLSKALKVVGNSPGQALGMVMAELGFNFGSVIEENIAQLTQEGLDPKTAAIVAGQGAMPAAVAETLVGMTLGKLPLEQKTFFKQLLTSPVRGSIDGVEEAFNYVGNQLGMGRELDFNDGLTAFVVGHAVGTKADITQSVADLLSPQGQVKLIQNIDELGYQVKIDPNLIAPDVRATVSTVKGDVAVVQGADGKPYFLDVSKQEFTPGDIINISAFESSPTGISEDKSIELLEDLSELYRSEFGEDISYTSLIPNLSKYTGKNETELYQAVLDTSVSESVSFSISVSTSISTRIALDTTEKQNWMAPNGNIYQIPKLWTDYTEAERIDWLNDNGWNATTLQNMGVANSDITYLVQKGLDKGAWKTTEEIALEADAKRISISESISVSQKQASDIKAEADRISISESISQKLAAESTPEAISASQALALDPKKSVSASISEELARDIRENASASVSNSISQAISMDQATSVSLWKSTSISLKLKAVEENQRISVSNSLSTSESLSTSASISVSKSVSQSASQSVSVSKSQSISAKLQPSVSASTSLSTAINPSLTVTQGISISQSVSELINPSLTVTQSTSINESVNPSVSVSQSVNHSVSVSQSVNPSVSVSQSVNPSVSVSQSVNPSVSVSQSVNPSVSVSVSVNPSVSVSVSVNPSVSVSQSVNPSASVSVSVNPSVSLSPSLVITTPTPTVTITEIGVSPTIPWPPTLSYSEQKPSSGSPKPPTTTTQKPPVTTTTAPPPPFPLFMIPGYDQTKRYIDYAQPYVPAPEFGPYDPFKAPNYLRPLQDTGNFGIAALIGAFNDGKPGDGVNQSK